MVVDPATGMPAEGLGNPDSTLGMYGSVMGQSYGVQNPLYYDVMNMIPPASTTMMWNMQRTRNTILANKSSGRLGANAGGLRQTFSPLRFGSLADLSNIDPEFFGTTRKSRRFPGMRGDKIPTGSATFAVGSNGDVIPAKSFRHARPGYTPFNFLSKYGNSVARSSFIPEKYRVAAGARAFAPGTFGTMSAMASINAGSYSYDRMSQVMGAANRFSFAPMGIGSQIPIPTILSTAGNQTFASTTIGATRLGTARYSGSMAGYFQGAQSARMGTVREMKAGLHAAKGGGYFGSAARSAVSNYAGEGTRAAQILARTAGSRGVALGLRAAPGVGTAMLAYDITKGLGTLAGRGARLGIDAVKSAQGDLIKRGPMGMGYVDNSVAATSRQRGVMAISNSRLNARSFLGQEASYLHQNFG